MQQDEQIIGGQRPGAPRETAFGRPRDFLGNRFVYLVISQRARGLTLGVNFNPDKQCSFDCLYCEVDRSQPKRAERLDVQAMVEELERTLTFIYSGQIERDPRYTTIPKELLELRDVVLSGDGEPTLCPNFSEAVAAIDETRRRGRFPFFKVVLLTNATGLDLPSVQAGLQLLTESDEVWAKLDAGTPEYMAKVNRTKVPMEKIVSNILLLGRQRPIVIASLFSLIGGQEPSAEEIAAYAERLNKFKNAGVVITQVQIYSAARPVARAQCGHLPLKSLSNIARTIHQATGLRTEVF